MLQLEIRGIHVEVDDTLKRYITKKIGRLDRFLSEHDKATAHAEIHLKETKAKDKKCAIAEITLKLPHDTIVIKESTLNMFAAVDIAEEKLKLQLHKHKDLRDNGKTKRRLFSRMQRRGGVPELEPQPEV